MQTPAVTELVQGFLLYLVMPLWIAAAFADWLCHRRSDIAHSSGLTEALMHWALLAQLGVPVLAATFFEINALVIALMLGGFLLHELTVYLDLRWSSARRDIAPIEQIVHSFQELVPFTAGILVLLMNWPAALSLLGLGDRSADFGLRPKAVPLTPGGMLAITGALLLFVALPYGEELLRCWKARPELKSGQRFAASSAANRPRPRCGAP